MKKHKEKYLAFSMICSIIAIALNLIGNPNLNVFQIIVIGCFIGLAMLAIALYLVQDTHDIKKS